MKVLMINVVCGTGSTGRICSDLAALLETGGATVRIAYGRDPVLPEAKEQAVRIGTPTDVNRHGLRARLSDGCGRGSKRATQAFIEWVKEYDPDVIHLNNLHGYYINVEILFDYLRTCGKRILWTLHDCWAFTGHAANCEAADCEKWQTGCGRCPNRAQYPRSFVDRSKGNWKRKKEWFTGIPGMTIITPSAWLAGLVRRSFLKEYPVAVIPNGVDVGVFRPTESDLRETLGLGDAKVALGVAARWNRHKGLADMLRLREMLDGGWKIVLVGLSDRQMQDLPDGVIGLKRTESVRDLAALYTLADVFVNPTYEDNYPTTNIEAIACGTPVVTYRTGGSPESAEAYGCAVEKGNITALAAAVRTEKFERKPLAVDHRVMLREYEVLIRQEDQ